MGWELILTAGAASGSGMPRAVSDEREPIQVRGQVNIPAKISLPENWTLEVFHVTRLLLSRDFQPCITLNFMETFRDGCIE